MPNFENFFQNASRTIHFVKAGTATVGSEPLEPQQKKFSVGDDTQIASMPVSVSGQLLARAQIYGLGKPAPLFEFDHPVASSASSQIASTPLAGSESRPEQAKPPSGSAYTEFELFIGADALTAFHPPTVQPLKIAAEAAASGSMHYRLLLPAESQTKRVDALTALLAAARPPQRVRLRELAPGELHSFDARFKLGFALEAEWGEDFDVSAVANLFDAISPTLKAHAQATVSASLGWSLYDRIQVSVGRANLSSDQGNWARVRVQRLNRRSLTLGAKLAVQVDYDIGQAAFAALLDHILSIEPLETLFGALDEVEKLGLEKISSEKGWLEVRGKLSGKLESLVLDYVDPAATIGELPWHKVEPFFQDISKLVAGYRGLDQKVQSLVEATLGRVDLGPGSKIRGSLDKISALDPADLDAMLAQFVEPDFGEAVDLLELLSGASLEELAIGSRATSAIEQAVSLASQTSAFLGALGDEAVARLHEFTQSSGIESVATWLETNATSTTKLRNGLERRADQKIRGVVQRLTGKAWDQLDGDDLDRIREFSQSLVSLNERRKEITEKLVGAVEKLKGSAGFSMGVEISRLTERAALLDLEVDIDNIAVRDLVESTALRDLSARELLERLPSPKDDDDDQDDDDNTDEDLGYRMRDSVFSYRRVRSSSMSSFASILGIQRSRKRQTIRVDEEAIRFGPASGSQRQATYSTGTVRRLIEEGTKQLAGSHELGVWLTQRFDGRGFDIDSTYASDTGKELRVSYSRVDSQTSPEELEALGEVLVDIGFATSPGGGIGGLLATGSSFDTDFSFAIEYGAAGAEALMATKDGEQFRRDYRNASVRWLDDRLGNRKKNPKKFEGELMSLLVSHQNFDGALRAGRDFYDRAKGEPWKIRIGGKKRSQPLAVKKISGKYEGRFNAITEVLSKCSRSEKKLADTVDQYKKAAGSLKPADLRIFGKRFATLLKRSPFADWPTPLFNLWWVHARIAQKRPAALADVRGLAELRFREDAGEAWQVLRWHLKGAHAPTEIFPCSRG